MGEIPTLRPLCCMRDNQAAHNAHACRRCPMHGSLILFIGLAAACTLILVREIGELPVPRGNLVLPPALCVGLGTLFLSRHPATGSIAAVLVGASIGVSTGLFGAQVVRIWRDQAAGVVLQRG